MNRDELEAQLRTTLNLCPMDSTVTCASCETRISSAMALIDQYILHRHGELWTAERVAQYTGHKDANAARSWLSRNGVDSVETEPHPDSGRPQALYPANHVRAACFRKALR